MLRRKWLISVVVVLSLFVLAACGTKTEQSAEGKLNKGQSAPSFELNDLNGNKVALASLAGQKVYIKYWASWCSICLGGLDEIDELSAQKQDFKVLTIVSPNFRGEQSAEDFKKWYKRIQDDNRGKNLTILLDEGGKFAQKFGVRGYPTSLYIGSDGVLVKSTPGHSDNETIITTFKDIS